MSLRKAEARTRNELIVEVWEQLDCESIGAAELERIQEAIAARFGPAAVDSPATIARLLAEEGAVLRHPEVLELDTVWRRRSNLTGLNEADFISLCTAAPAMKKLDTLRKGAEQSKDGLRLRRIREFSLELRQELLFIVNNKARSQREQVEAGEIIEWLSVWQRTPELFTDWLELRLVSKEFRTLFPNFSSL